MKRHGAWLYGVHRTRPDGSSFLWHQPCQNCKYTTSVDILKKRRYKKLFTHVESHASAVSLLESGNTKKSQVHKPLLSVQSLSTASPMQCLLVATHVHWAPQGPRLDSRDSEDVWPPDVRHAGSSMHTAAGWASNHAAQNVTRKYENLPCSLERGTGGHSWTARTATGQSK